jgi:hypothetical protein
MKSRYDDVLEVSAAAGDEEQEVAGAAYLGAGEICAAAQEAVAFIPSCGSSLVEEVLVSCSSLFAR